MEIQTIDIKDLIKLMDENPNEFIVTVIGLDEGGEEGRRQHFSEECG